MGNKKVFNSHFPGSQATLTFEDDPSFEVGGCLVVVSDHSGSTGCGLSPESARSLAGTLWRYYLSTCPVRDKDHKAAMAYLSLSTGGRTSWENCREIVKKNILRNVRFFRDYFSEQDSTVSLGDYLEVRREATFYSETVSSLRMQCIELKKKLREAEQDIKTFGAVMTQDSLNRRKELYARLGVPPYEESTEAVMGALDELNRARVELNELKLQNKSMESALVQERAALDRIRQAVNNPT